MAIRITPVATATVRPPRHACRIRLRPSRCSPRPRWNSRPRSWSRSSPRMERRPRIPSCWRRDPRRTEALRSHLRRSTSSAS